MAVQRRIASRFVLGSEVGRGTSGVVYQAYDEERGERVALKLLSSLREGAAESLMQEAQLLSSLSHPNIVKLCAYGTLDDENEEGSAYIAMEWLEGEDLGRRQKRSPLSLGGSLRLIATVADALHAAHLSGVVHRDIKPANIFLTYPDDPENPVPQLLDFGAATHWELLSLSDGAIVGTPAYMAPEQVRGEGALGPRSDLFSLGATLYELIAGHPPHEGPSFLATLARLATTVPRRLSELRPDVPLGLDYFVHRLLALNPEDRPENAREVALELRRLIGIIARGTLADSEPRSSRLGSSVLRLVTTMVALRFDDAHVRGEALLRSNARGAEVFALGPNSLVAHFGARRAVGNEAAGALKLGRLLASWGAQIGVATGRTMVPYVDLDDPIPALGDVVDRATALAREAASGQVLADATTSELGRGRYEFLVRQDGSAVVNAASKSNKEPAGGTPFVGRDAELGRIKTAFERALAEKNPVVVTISGAPGIGKTRLQREALARLGNRQETQLVHQRSEAYGSRRALGAAVDALRSMLKLGKARSIEESSAAILAHIGEAPETELLHGVDVLARLLAGQQLQQADDPRGYRDVLWLLMTRLVERSLERGPLLIQAEDLHWADRESVEWLNHLVGRVHGKPLFLLLTARHEFFAEHPDCFAQRDHVRIELRPMSGRATRLIAQSVLGDRGSEATIARIVEQAAGSPLFAEELARLSASGRNVEQAPTIQVAIQVSLDALDEDQVDALRRLSVLGFSGWDACLKVMGIEAAADVLTELASLEILTEQSSSRFPGMREWQFKHALVRDVVYQSLANEHRLSLHTLAAEWLDAQGDDAAVIARHFELSSHPQRAAEFWAVAAKQAMATHSLKEALSMAERALSFASTKEQGFARAKLLDEAWSRLDPRGSDRDSAVRAMTDNRYDEISTVYAAGARARYDAARGQGLDIDTRLGTTRDQAQRLGLHDEEAKCSAELATRAAFGGRFTEAEKEAANLLSLAERPGMRAAAVDAWQTLAIVRQSEGSLSQALDARRSAAAAARDADLRERESILTTNLGFALTTLGSRKEARELLTRGLALAEAIGSRGARHHAQMLLMCWAGAFGSDRELDGILSDVRADADAAAGNIWTAPARENLGVLYYRGVELLGSNSRGNRERARSLLKLSAEAYRTTDNRDVLPVALGMWARAELLCGQPERALSLASEAAELLAAGAPSLLNEAVVFLALHDAHSHRGDPAQAREAVGIAMSPLLRRLRGLRSTTYVKSFLIELKDNSSLIALAENYGCLPYRVREVLGRDAG